MAAVDYTWRRCIPALQASNICRRLDKDGIRHVVARDMRVHKAVVAEGIAGRGIISRAVVEAPSVL